MKKKAVSQAKWRRLHVYYSGRVQGVGFRFTAERLATDLGLTGWVKNLPDGRVEIVCEGAKADLDLFLLKIRESCLGPHITRAVSAWEEPRREFEDFCVEFCL